MHCRTRDTVIFPSPGNIGKKFGDDETIGRIPYMFPESPPTKIIDLFHLFVGTFEQRDVGGKKFKRLTIGNTGSKQFIVFRIEFFYIVF